MLFFPVNQFRMLSVISFIPRKLADQRAYNTVRGNARSTMAPPINPRAPVITPAAVSANAARAGNARPIAAKASGKAMRPIAANPRAARPATAKAHAAAIISIYAAAFCTGSGRVRKALDTLINRLNTGPNALSMVPPNAIRTRSAAFWAYCDITAYDSPWRFNASESALASSAWFLINWAYCSPEFLVRIRAARYASCSGINWCRRSRLPSVALAIS